jgi:hypothetical protein
MIEFKIITLESLPKYVKIAFKGDDRLNEYHITGSKDLDKCVEDTMDKINETSTLFELLLLSVIFEEQIIGFTVLGGGLLYSFGINKQYRTKEILTDWIKEVKELLDNDFKCILWNKNSRAIKFLERQGMEIEDINNDYTTLNYTLCH